MFGNIIINLTANNKLSFYFPHKKLKKVKVVTDEYYEIKIDFLSGGEGVLLLWIRLKVMPTSNSKQEYLLKQLLKEVLYFGKKPRSKRFYFCI